MNIKIWKYSIAFLALPISLLISCTGSASGKKAGKNIYPASTQADWLTGTWQNTDAKGAATEIWKKENDSTFKAVSFYITGTDTLFSEKITIEERKGKLFLIPEVKDQNGGKPVKFELTSTQNKTLLFENSTHDFPQKIMYRSITADSLVAEISGIEKGESKAIRFPMKKIN